MRYFSLDIYPKFCFKRFSEIWKILNFCEIDIIGCKSSKTFIETCGNMTRFYKKRAFIFLCFILVFFYIFTQTYHEKTSRIPTLILNRFIQNIESINLSCKTRSNSCLPLNFILRNMLCSSSRIIKLLRRNIFLFEIMIALIKRLWVRNSCFYICYIIFKSKKTMINFKIIGSEN